MALRKSSCRAATLVEQLVQDLAAGSGPGGRKWKRTSINPMLARTEAVRKDLERRKVPRANTHDSTMLRPMLDAIPTVESRRGGGLTRYASVHATPTRHHHVRRSPSIRLVSERRPLGRLRVRG